MFWLLVSTGTSRLSSSSLSWSSDSLRRLADSGTSGSPVSSTLSRSGCFLFTEVFSPSPLSSIFWRFEGDDVRPAVPSSASASSIVLFSPVLGSACCWLVTSPRTAACSTAAAPLRARARARAALPELNVPIFGRRGGTFSKRVMWPSGPISKGRGEEAKDG